MQTHFMCWYGHALYVPINVSENSYSLNFFECPPACQNMVEITMGDENLSVIHTKGKSQENKI